MPRARRCAASALHDARRGDACSTTSTSRSRAGELVGVAGVAGNGQRELYEVALGLRPPTSGTVDDRRQRRRPARRPRRSLEPAPSACPRTRSRDVGRAGPRRARARRPRRPRPRPQAASASTGRKVAAGYRERDEASRAARSPPATGSVATLSGGNIQRVMLVRTIAGDATLVVAAYPSRGLDIATTRRTQELLLERRAAGAGVLLISRGPRRAVRAVRPHRRAARRRASPASSIPRTTDRYEVGRLMLGAARRTTATTHDDARRCGMTADHRTTAPRRRRPSPADGGHALAERARPAARAGRASLAAFVAALVIFGVVMLAKGVNPITAYADMVDVDVQQLGLDRRDPRRGRRRSSWPASPSPCRPGRADQRRRRGPADHRRRSAPSACRMLLDGSAAGRR